MYACVSIRISVLLMVVQVEGKEGLSLLVQKCKREGPSALYQGAVASTLATVVGHYPWFTTFNFLNSVIPPAAPDDTLLKLGRSALLGRYTLSMSKCVP